MAKSTQKGFTIVELLIVIVVIAILAAISIVAYNGIQNRSKTVSGASTASNLAKKIEAYNTIETGYPVDLAALNAGASPDYKYDDTAAVVAYLAGSGAGGVDAAGTYVNGSKIRVVYQRESSAAGGCVWYWNYTKGTPAKSGVKVGPTTLSGCTE